MMDRNHADELPKMQCGFIDFVCCFVYKVHIQNEIPRVSHSSFPHICWCLFRRSLLVSTLKFSPCSMGWITTGASGKLLQISMRPRWRRLRTRRRSQKKGNKVDRQWLRHIIYQYCQKSLMCIFICCLKVAESQRRVSSVKPLRPLTHSRMFISMCLFTQHKDSYKYAKNIIFICVGLLPSDPGRYFNQHLTIDVYMLYYNIYHTFMCTI